MIVIFSASLGAIFGITTCLSAHVREADDPANYFLGGCASGAFLGARSEYIKDNFGKNVRSVLSRCGHC